MLPGAELFSGQGDSQPVGRIVDAQPHPDGGQRALAVIQIQSADADDAFLHSAAGPAFERRRLPYAFEPESGKPQ